MRSMNRAGARILLPLFGLLAALAWSGSSRAAGYGAEGEPSFGISGYFESPPRLNEPTTLLVRVWGEDSYDVPVMSRARISVPDGIQVISGDTLSVAHVDRHTRHRAERLLELTIRPVRYGSYVLRGWLSIDAGEDRGVDETDFHLPFTIEADTTYYAHAPRPTRFENVRHGQRYRYGGRYLVPIDSTQALLEEEITSKPHATRQEAASCHGCAGPLPTIVPFVVMIGADGKLREARFLDIQEQSQAPTDPAWIEAAKRALATWEFEPAHAGTLPVADYVVVRVPVRDGNP